MDPQAEPDLLEAGKNDCRTPRRRLDQTCLQLEPSSINQARKQRRPAKRWDDDCDICLKPTRSNRGINDLTSDTTWLTTAEDSSKWNAMESDVISTGIGQPASPTTPITTTSTTQPTTHDQTTSTTKAHDQNEDDTKDGNDTLLILSQIIDS